MKKITNRPDPNAAFPNPKIPSLCFIKNVVKNPRIIIGDYGTSVLLVVFHGQICFHLTMHRLELPIVPDQKNTYPDNP